MAVQWGCCCVHSCTPHAANVLSVISKLVRTCQNGADKAISPDPLGISFRQDNQPCRGGQGLHNEGILMSIAAFLIVQSGH